ncbi:hypothetical protein SAMN02910456_01628 [Ruminococcaceae bacterium YRB3002]|nr:hypothetical protein SAMN02910456_01628 [Ruminococcaceae bacterium YRB3002]
MLDALNGKDWLAQFRYYSSKDCECGIEELRAAYIQMTMNYMNELVNTKQLEEFISSNYGEEQVERLAVEGAYANRLMRVMCVHPDDLEKQAEDVANFIEFTVFKN